MLDTHDRSEYVAFMERDISLEMAAVDLWLKQFNEQRVAVEQAIHEKSPIEKRRQIIQAARSAMPDDDLVDVAEIEMVAADLDAKLNDMVNVLLNRATGQFSDIPIPSNIERSDAFLLLQDQTCRDERSWLFVGRMVEILHQYRNEGRALLLDKRKRLLKGLDSSVKKVTSTIQELDSHLLVTSTFSYDQRAQIDELLSHMQTVQSLYATALQLESDDGLCSYLENNRYKLKGQFLLACCKLAFELYGNVSSNYLMSLLVLKQSHTLTVPGSQPNPSDRDQTEEAERRYMDRTINDALKQVRSKAQRELWATEPLLKFFEYNTRFCRNPSALRNMRVDDGDGFVGEATDYGASLLRSY